MLCGAARWLSLRGRPYFVDEALGLLTGWMLASGRRLYDTAFSHHLPFEYMFFQAAAPRLWLARVLAWGLWAGACLGLHACLRRRGREQAWIAPAFAALGAVWAPFRSGW